MFDREEIEPHVEDEELDEFSDSESDHMDGSDDSSIAWSDHFDSDDWEAGFHNQFADADDDWVTNSDSEPNSGSDSEWTTISEDSESDTDNEHVASGEA